MGIIPTIVAFLLVTWANVINTKYLIDANEGLKKRNLQVHNGMVIENDLRESYVPSARLRIDVTTSFTA